VKSQNFSTLSHGCTFVVVISSCPQLIIFLQYLRRSLNAWTIHRLECSIPPCHLFRRVWVRCLLHHLDCSKRSQDPPARMDYMGRFWVHCHCDHDRCYSCYHSQSSSICAKDWGLRTRFFSFTARRDNICWCFRSIARHLFFVSKYFRLCSSHQRNEKATRLLQKRLRVYALDYDFIYGTRFDSVRLLW
jgi:hypothetical protein